MAESKRGYAGAKAIGVASPFDRPKTTAKANAGSKAKVIRVAGASTRDKAKSMVEETINFVADLAIARAYLCVTEYTEPL